MEFRTRVAMILLATALAQPAGAVEAPSSLQGIWSPDLSCDTAALRHIVGRTTLEWRDGGERIAEADVHYRVRGNDIAATVQQVRNGDASLRPGDVVTYQRVAGGLRPLTIERNGAAIDISRPRTFFQCRR
ncbi:hypothetical protein [Elioraea tepidiphila]|jgi:hypothetical protein|uniref:hypothetical protein n=1 Tax=Elioraea tepidiphila TaxID=457934 RepID=UPI000369676C|nr:hypothetical protein [Elioraea tepidiphila]